MRMPHQIGKGGWLVRRVAAAYEMGVFCLHGRKGSLP